MAVSTLLGVGLAVTLRDNFTGPASRITATSKELKTALRGLASAQSTYYRNLSSATVALGTVSAGLSDVVMSAAKYKYEMVSVGAVTQSTASQLEKMDKLAIKLSNDTIFQAQEIASAMKFMGMAGVKARDIMASMPAVVNLAGATDTKIGGKGGAADIITNIMHTFGIASNKTGEITDILTAATIKANLSINDLGESLKYVGATVKNLNIPLKDTSAAIMTLGNSGIQGSMAGVALENALRYFTRSIGSGATKAQKKALQTLGLSRNDFVTAKGNLIALDELFGKVGERINRIKSVDEKQGLMTTLFGVRGQRAAAGLIRNNLEQKQFLGDLGKSNGMSSGIMERRMSTLLGYIFRVRDSLKSLGISFVETITPSLKVVLGGLNGLLKVLHAIMDSGVGKVVIGPLITYLILWKAKTIAQNVILARQNMVLMKNKVAALEAGRAGILGMNGFTNATYQATTAQERLNISMMRGMTISNQMVASRFANTAWYAGWQSKKAPNVIGGAVQGKKIGGNTVWYSPRTGNAINTGGAYHSPQRAGGGQYKVQGVYGRSYIFSTRKEAQAFYDKRVQGVSGAMRNRSIANGTKGAWFITTPGGNIQTFSTRKGALRGINRAGNAIAGTSWLTKATSSIGKLFGGTKILAWLRPIGVGLGRIVGFLTGPVGMLISLLVTFLPGIWGLIKSWFGSDSESQDKQTKLLNSLVDRDKEILEGALVRSSLRFLNTATPELKTIQEVQNNPNLDTQYKQKEIEAIVGTLGQKAEVKQGPQELVTNVTLDDQVLFRIMQTFVDERVNVAIEKQFNN